MRFSSRTDYALRATLELAAHGEGSMTTAELGRVQEIPANYLGAVMADLRRAGIVKARRGADGGWSLARDASAISFADVIRAIDGTLVNVAGTRPEKLSYRGPAAGLKTALIAVRAAEREVLESISLADGVNEQFPDPVQRLLANPNAWQ